MLIRITHLKPRSLPQLITIPALNVSILYTRAKGRNYGDVQKRHLDSNYVHHTAAKLKAIAQDPSIIILRVCNGFTFCNKDH